jgi:hypothetical protein
MPHRKVLEQHPPEDVAKLREYVMQVYREAAADNDTFPAAFGVGCKLIQEKLHCSLKVSALLMQCWIDEYEAKVKLKGHK